MTLRRFAAVVGFCFMLISATLITHVFLLLWLHGTDEITLYVDLVRERSVELWLVFFGYCFVPIAVYEVDRLLRDQPR